MDIRRLEPDDVPALAAIDPGVVSDSILDVTVAGTGLERAWRLTERALPAPFAGGRSYVLLPEDLEALHRRVVAGQGLYLVAEEAGRPAALLDLEVSEWNDAGLLWNLLVDRGARRQGLGRALFAEAVRYCQRQRLRAILIETQTNNVPACRFYAAMGCELAGLNTAQYGNADVEDREVALFWVYRVEAGEDGR